jgi:hypothetical protein
MYEFRWEWAAGDEQKRLFTGETPEEVLGKVVTFMRNEMSVQPTQTLLRFVALLTRKSSETQLKRRWVLRSPITRPYS